LQNDSTESGPDPGFAARLEAVYTARGYDADPHYSEFSPTYLQRVQSMESAYLGALRRFGIHKRLEHARALDFGCGNGHWMARMISWGFVQENLFGADVRDGAVRAARQLLPGCHIERNVDGVLPFASDWFDVCLVNLVFTSILDEERRRQAADELRRVTRPGGVILVLDFRFNNPANPNVRMLGIRQLSALFHHCKLSEHRSLVLAPPIAARVAPWSRWLTTTLESFPFLRTHFLAALRKPDVESLQS
jgi:SAM-dependent methyltransferase